MLEGILLCPDCGREHPIIDGIPVVVGDLVSWASHQLGAVLRRDDLSPLVESVLGDAAGPGSDLDRERTNLSGYGQTHWGDGSFAALVEAAVQLLEARPAGVWIDHGCAVGRGTLELARRTGDLAVGIDLSFAMLRVAERVRRSGRAVFPRKRVGLVFDRIETRVEDVPAERLSFWCCDVAALPFPDATFAGALSLNVLDCAASPLGHLQELSRTLQPDGRALLSTPYDWSASATQPLAWIGGHSQRGELGGEGPAVLRHALPQAGLEVEDERDGVPWAVYANERSRVEYSLHLLRLVRSAQAR